MVREQCPVVPRRVLEPMARMVAALTREIKALDKQIDELGRRQYEATERLRMVAGVGALTSLA